MALQTRVPKGPTSFDGSMPWTNFFLFCCFAEAADIPAHRWARQLLEHLAPSVVTILYHAGLAGSDDVDAFAQKLQECFGAEEDVSDWEMKLDGCSQRQGESLASLADRISFLAEKAGVATTSTPGIRK